MQKERSSTDPINYRQPEDNNVEFDAQQLLSGELQIEQFFPLQELERMKTEGQQALINSHFSTPHERKTAELVQRNTDGWIDTAKDVLTVGVEMVGLGKFVSIIKKKEIIDLIVRPSANMRTSY